MRVPNVFLTAMILLLPVVAIPQAQIAHGFSGIFALDPLMEVDTEDFTAVTGLTSIIPNPFNFQTTIEFTLAESGVVELAVFDLRGRIVRVLDRGPRLYGPYRSSWNGCDNEGRSKPTGVYFCRLVSSRGVQIKMLTLVK